MSLQITLLPEFVDQIKNKCENDAHDYRSHQWKIKCEISFPEKNITGQFADEWNFACKKKNASKQNQNNAGYNKSLSHVAQSFGFIRKLHRFLILQFGF